MMYGHGWMFGGSGMFFGGLWMILVWAILLLVLLALLKYLLFANPRPGQSSFPGRRIPLDDLKEAYIRGKISREEYLQKRNDITEKEGEPSHQ